MLRLELTKLAQVEVKEREQNVTMAEQTFAAASRVHRPLWHYHYALIGDGK